MKRLLLFLTVLSLICAIVSCNNYETYAAQKDRERDAINSFIAFRGINVIEESAFHAQNDSTSLAKNEYVYLNNSGVYMQIVRRGCGKTLQNGENTELQIRFYEQSLLDTNNLMSNNSSPFDPDVMSISRTGTTYTASFSYGAMYSVYSASVPAGWLVAFPYIKVDPPEATGNIAKVRLIVPHTQGHSVASSNVYPYFYEITFQRTPGL